MCEMGLELGENPKNLLEVIPLDFQGASELIEAQMKHVFLT